MSESVTPVAPQVDSSIKNKNCGIRRYIGSPYKILPIIATIIRIGFDAIQCDGEMLSTKVITEVAAREGVDPLELEEPLYEIVDVSALEKMVESASGQEGTFEVSFSYYGYDVSVDGVGDVTVTEQATVEESSERTADQSAAGR